jgi:acetyl esterase
MSLDPILKGLLDQMAANPMPKIWEIPPPAGREMYKGMAAMLDPQDVPIGKVEDRKIPGPGGDVPVRIYTPMGAGAAALPAVVFFHGGGFVIGDLQTHDALCRQIANGAKARVIAVDYRLAPEHKFPAAADDCFAALKWVAAQASAIGVDANRIAVCGDSAGGNLSAVVCQMAKAAGGPHIVYQVLMYPTTIAHAKTGSMKDFERGYFLEREAMDWFFDAYVPKGHDMKDPKLAPFWGDVKGLPPAYVITAGFDPLKDEGKQYADKMSAAGVHVTYKDYPALVHGFFNMSAVVPQAKEAIAEVAAKLRGAFG